MFWTANDYSERLQGEMNHPLWWANYGGPVGNEFERRWPDNKIQNVPDTSYQDGANPDEIFVDGEFAAGLTLGVGQDHAVFVEDAADCTVDADSEIVAVEIVYAVVEVVVDGADDSYPLSDHGFPTSGYC